MSKTTNTAPRYTYVSFAEDCAAIAKLLEAAPEVLDGTDFTEERMALFTDKAAALLGAQVKKAEYSATHPSKSKKAKGPSAETLERAEAILNLIGNSRETALTGKEIMEALPHLGLTTLTVSNALRSSGVPFTSVKVVREVLSSNGNPVSREYTAYYKTPLATVGE